MSRGPPASNPALCGERHPATRAAPSSSGEDYGLAKLHRERAVNLAPGRTAEARGGRGARGARGRAARAPGGGGRVGGGSGAAARHGLASRWCVMHTNCLPAGANTIHTCRKLSARNSKFCRPPAWSLSIAFTGGGSIAAHKCEGSDRRNFGIFGVATKTFLRPCGSSCLGKMVCPRVKCHAGWERSKHAFRRSAARGEVLAPPMHMHHLCLAYGPAYGVQRCFYTHQGAEPHPARAPIDRKVPPVADAMLAWLAHFYWRA
jgi:hypothetical protein